MKPLRLSIATALLSLSLLLWEILLTRLFSVLLYYYFAFVVLSLAMLGLTVGAISVLNADVPEEKLPMVLARHALWTSLGMMVGIFAVVGLGATITLRSAVGRMILLFALSFPPFLSAGKFLCLVLSRKKNISLFYAADLFGAALGCLLVGGLLFYFGGAGAICAAAVPAAVASAILSKRRNFWRISMIGLVCIGTLVLAKNPSGRFQLHSGAGYPPTRPLFERWNAFSRIAVFKYPISLNWGISPLLDKTFPPAEQLQLEVDCGSMTPLTRFDGNVERLSYLKKDITAFAHYLRPRSKVLIIGPGGGRDVLAALVFGQPDIRAAEINPAIIEAVNGRFGDFTGHLDRFANVRFVNSEGRNYVERSHELFGIIQLSLVDTWSASAAGAYAFIENGLYTIESWKSLLSHLAPGGVLSLTRWYYASEQWPVHIFRACVLGMETLRQMGVSSPERCIVVLRLPKTQPDRSYVGTVMISPQPFTENDLTVLANECRASGCEIAYSWKTAADSVLALLIQSSDSAEFISTFPLDISAPTDDRPYFQFHDRLFSNGDRVPSENKQVTPGGYILKLLLFVVAILSVLLIAVPAVILMRRKAVWSRETVAFSGYFALIGLAYFFVELALIQRFGLFLGHPSYGFTVILFGLLFSSACGSVISDRLHPKWAAAILVAALALFPVAGVSVLSVASNAGVFTRIVLTLVFVWPLGFLMGTFLPWGLAAAQVRQAPFVRWYWAVNGAMSVFGAVLGMTCLIAFGEARTLSLAAAFYAVSGIILIRFMGEERRHATN